MLVWIDLETTGLVASKERVLEVACIITDDRLNEVARFERVTNEARFVDFTQVDPFVIEMHFANGLWRESLLKGSAYANSLLAADMELAQFIVAHAHVKRTITKDDGTTKEVVDKPQLAGSTISFDRAFLDVHFVRAANELHYRNVDVSSFNEVAKRVWPYTFEGRPRDGGSKHRAMDDIVNSLSVMRHYVNNLGPRFAGEGNPNP